MLVFENGQNARQDGKITEMGKASFQTCSRVSVVANVNDEEKVLGIVRVRVLDGSSVSVILKF